MQPRYRKLHLALKAAISVPAALALALPTTAHAISAVGSGNWESPVTWGGTVPGTSPSDTATINVSDPPGAIVTYSTNTGTKTIASLQVGNTTNNKLNITGGDLTVTGITNVGVGGTNTVNVQGGTLRSKTYNNLANGASLATTNVSSGSLLITNSGTLTNKGAITVSGTGSINGSGTAITILNTKSINVTGGALGDSSTIYTQNTGGSLSISGGTNSFGKATLNAGAATVSGGSLDLNAATGIASGASMTVQGGTVTNTGTGTLTNAGTVTVSSGSLSNQGTLSNTKTVTVSGSGSLTGGTITNVGSINVTAGIFGNSATTYTQNAGGSLSISGGTNSLGASTLNAGAATVSGGSLDLNAATSIVGGASMAVQGGTVTNKGTGTLSNAGTVAVSSGSLSNEGTLNNTNAVTISGTGSLANTGSLNNTGGSLTNSATVNTSGSLAGGSITNSGTINVTAGTFGNSATTYTQNAGGTLSVSGGTNGLGNTSLNAGTATVSGGSLDLNAATSIASSASMTVQGTGTVTNTATGTLSNAGIVTVSSGNLNNQGIFNNTNSTTVSAGGTLTNTGNLNNTGGVLSNSGTLNSNGASANLSGGTINNNGSLNVTGGTFGDSSTTVNQSAGTLAVSNSATNNVGTLNISGGTLNLATGADKISVSSDYSNTNFGDGNTFNARANVSGGGSIIASGDAKQGLIINGAAADNANTVAMAFGNVHVSNSATYSQDYKIANTGLTGPSIRGAIQNQDSGANPTITDDRLSGSGLAAGNYTSKTGAGALALNSSTASYGVTFSPTSAGSLNGQTLQVVDNFGDKQTLSITGAAYRYASASAPSPSPVNLGNVHEGGTFGTQALSITNAAPNDGYSEKLNASISSTTAQASGSGSFNSLAPQATDNSSLVVGLGGNAHTATAGHVSGQAIISLVSDGAGTSGLGQTSLGDQAVTVQGTVWRLASASEHAPEPVALAPVHVGSSFGTQALSITNTAAADGYSEKLNASIGGATGQASANGSFNLLAPQATNNSSLVIGLGGAANTGSAGTKSGTAVISLVSDGDTNGLGQTALPNQTVQVSGDVYNYAQAGLVNPVNASLTLNGTTPSTSTYTLNFGSFALGAGGGSATAHVDIKNLPTSLTDLLQGAWSYQGGTNPTEAFTFDPASFLNIAGGDSSTFNLHFDTDAGYGSWTRQIIFAWSGLNHAMGDWVGTADGEGTTRQIILNLSANIQSPPTPGLPEPGILWLFGSSSVSAWMASRRKSAQKTKA